jgi:predicted secreted protein
MPKTKVLARNWTIEAGEESGTPGTYTWTKVGGVNTFTISSDKTDADTTDFDSGGRDEHIVAGRSNEITFEGWFLEDETGVRDAGQAKIEDFGDLIGPESIKPLRLTSPGGKVRQFNGSFVVGDVGGGNNDATSWGATFTPSGPVVTVTA